MSRPIPLDVLDSARRHLEQGHFRQVLALCRPLLKDAPRHPELCSLAAAAFLGLGRAFQALRVVAPACELNPERTDLQALSASCLLAGGKFELARQNVERMLRLAPDDRGLVAAAQEAETRIVELDRLLNSVSRSLLDLQQRSALQSDFRSSHRTVPIIINSRDRLSGLERLVAWLRAAGYLNIAILDNQSTYPPLVDYLRGIESEVVVLRSPRNLGPRALWSSGLIGMVADVPFIYTDPDVLPVEECPADAAVKLFDLLSMHPHATKAGLGIRIDDIPDTYEHKAEVQAWEANFWRRPLAGNCYDAAVDTTLALYRPGSWHQLEAVRSGPPYVVRHLPWYADSSMPSPEDRYYADHARSQMSSWGGKGISDLYERRPSGDADDGA